MESEATAPPPIRQKGRRFLRYEKMTKESKKQSGEIRKLIRRAGENPIDVLIQIQTSVKKLDAGYRLKIRSKVAGVFAGARELLKRPEEWAALLKNPFWRDVKKPPQRGDTAKVLWWAMFFAFDGREEHAYNRVSKYTTALERAFEKKWSPEKLCRAIDKAGGIDKFYELSKKTRKANTSKEGGTDSKHKKTTPTGDSDDDSSSSTRTGRGANNDEGLGKAVKRGPATKVRTLNVEVTEAQLETAREATVGQRIKITAKRAKGDGDWVRLVAKKVQLIPDKKKSGDDEDANPNEDQDEEWQ